MTHSTIDSVYGPISFREPVLVELIESEPLKRLKGVSQAGYPEPFFPGSDHSRFDHSLGVSALLARFGAGLPEQVAGLLHDVSHTAFSHCVDYVLEEASGAEQSYQDEAFERFVRTSEIPAILSRHGIDPNAILQLEDFPLLERELPDLCADRIDYILRTGIHTKELTTEGAARFLAALTVQDGHWAFTDTNTAEEFASYFLGINLKYYCGVASAKMFHSVGEVLKYALLSGYLTRDDLFGTDATVIAKISPHLETDPRMRAKWETLHHPESLTAVRREGSGTVLVACKSRVIDPFCLVKGRLKRLSSLNAEWGFVVKSQSEPKAHFLKT